MLVDIYPGDIDKEESAEQADASQRSSAFTNNLDRMRTIGILDYPTPAES